MSMMGGDQTARSDSGRFWCAYHKGPANLLASQETIQDGSTRQVYRCSQCNRIIGAFARDPQKPSDVTIFSCFGYKNHGKTVYLASLFELLHRRLAHYWNGYTFRFGEHNTLTTVTKLVGSIFDAHTLPENTPAVIEAPSLCLMQNIPGAGATRAKQLFIVFQDTSGETILSGELTNWQLHHLALARTAVMIVSLPEVLGGGPAHANAVLDDCLQNYALSMVNNFAPRRGSPNDYLRHQTLVVVYTQADRVMDSIQFDSMVRDYIQEGADPPHPRYLPEYYERMEEISAQLQLYTRRKLKAEQAVNFAANTFKDVKFCAVSALGHNLITDRKLAADPTPKRVIDPLLWALIAPGTVESGWDEPTPPPPPPFDGGSGPRPPQAEARGWLAWLKDLFA